MATSIEVNVEEMEQSQVTCIPFAVLVPPVTSFGNINNNDIIDDDDDNENSAMKIKQPKKNQQPTQTPTPKTKSTKIDPMMIDSTTSSSVIPSLDYGVVGTILFLGPKSVLLWFGWGQIDQKKQKQSSTTTTEDNNSFSIIPSNINNCSMGPLLVSMPQFTNKTSSSQSVSFNNNNNNNNSIGTTSKLIGGSSAHTEMIVQQMSSRLSSKLNISLLVSCSLDNDDNNYRISSIAANHNNSTNTGSIIDDSYEMTTSRAAAFTEKEIYRILYNKLYATTNETTASSSSTS